MGNTPTLALYEVMSEYVDYDPNKGTFYRKKVKDAGAKGRLCGPVNIKNKCLTVAGRQYMLRIVAYILMKKRRPQGKLAHKDGNELNYKWDNIVEALPKKRGNRGTTQRELVNGKLMEVDPSRSAQPRTPANQKRKAGECKGCQHYINRCLANEMKLPCLGWKKEKKRFERSTISSGGKLNAFTTPRY